MADRIDMDGEANVVALPVKAKRRTDAPITVAPKHGGCRHLHTVVDERLAEVTCRDCGEKLSPLWVLARLANEDDRLRNAWADMRVQIASMKERTRVKCRHCERFTPVPSAGSYHQQLVLREQMRKADAEREDTQHG